jgi:Spy/CpxP family protein refolding chaperone
MKKQWFASVLLTVLLSASGTAYVYAHDGNGQDGGKPCHHVQLSDEQKQLLHQTMKATFEKDKPLFDKMHEFHKQLHAVVAADKFDAKAFESLNTRIEQTRDKIRNDRVHAFASIAAKFTPEEREAILRHQAHRHHHHGDHEGQPMAWKHGTDGQQQGWQGHNSSVTTPSTDGITTDAPAANNDYPPYPKR